MLQTQNTKASIAECEGSENKMQELMLEFEECMIANIQHIFHGLENPFAKAGSAYEHKSVELASSAFLSGGHEKYRALSN